MSKTESEKKNREAFEKIKQDIQKQTDEVEVKLRLRSKNNQDYLRSWFRVLYGQTLMNMTEIQFMRRDVQNMMNKVQYIVKQIEGMRDDGR